MLELPDESLRLLGLISVNFVALERMLILTISDSIGIGSKLTDRLIATDSFDTLLSIFEKSLIYIINDKKIKDKSILEEFNRLINRLSKVNERRNKIIHSYYYVDENGDIVRHKYKKKMNKDLSIDEVETMTELSLNKYLNEIDKNIFDLNSFRKRIIIKKRNACLISP